MNLRLQKSCMSFINTQLLSMMCDLKCMAVRNEKKNYY